MLGIPGAADRAALIRTSLRIGVGDSVRYLRRQGKRAARLMASAPTNTVATKIAAATTPLVTGVGHETDVTLADLAGCIDGASEQAAFEAANRINAYAVYLSMERESME